MEHEFPKNHSSLGDDESFRISNDDNEAIGANNSLIEYQYGENNHKHELVKRGAVLWVVESRPNETPGLPVIATPVSLDAGHLKAFSSEDIRQSIHFQSMSEEEVDQNLKDITRQAIANTEDMKTLHEIPTAWWSYVRDVDVLPKLARASEEERLAILDRLIAANTNPAEQNENKQTALFLAAEYGSEVLCAHYLKAYKNDDVDLIFAKDVDRHTALTIAAQNGHDKIVKILAQFASNDVDVNDPDNDFRRKQEFLAGYRNGDSLLSKAARFGQANIIREWVSHALPFFEQGDIDVPAELFYGIGINTLPPLAAALIHGHADAVNEIVEWIWRYDDQSMRELLQLSVIVDGREILPIEKAFENGHAEAAQVWLHAVLRGPFSTAEKIKLFKGQTIGSKAQRVLPSHTLLTTAYRFNRAAVITMYLNLVHNEPTFGAETKYDLLRSTNRGGRDAALFAFQQGHLEAAQVYLNTVLLSSFTDSIKETLLLMLTEEQGSALLQAMKNGHANVTGAFVQNIIQSKLSYYSKHKLLFVDREVWAPKGQYRPLTYDLLKRSLQLGPPGPLKAWLYGVIHMWGGRTHEESILIADEKEKIINDHLSFIADELNMGRPLVAEVFLEAVLTYPFPDRVKQKVMDFKIGFPRRSLLYLSVKHGFAKLTQLLTDEILKSNRYSEIQKRDVLTGNQQAFEKAMSAGYVATIKASMQSVFNSSLAPNLKRELAEIKSSGNQSALGFYLSNGRFEEANVIIDAILKSDLPPQDKKLLLVAQDRYGIPEVCNAIARADIDHVRASTEWVNSILESTHLPQETKNEIVGELLASKFSDNTSALAMALSNGHTGMAALLIRGILESGAADINKYEQLVVKNKNGHILILQKPEMIAVALNEINKSNLPEKMIDDFKLLFLLRRVIDDSGLEMSSISAAINSDPSGITTILLIDELSKIEISPALKKSFFATKVEGFDFGVMQLIIQGRANVVEKWIHGVLTSNLSVDDKIDLLTLKSLSGVPLISVMLEKNRSGMAKIWFEAIDGHAEFTPEMKMQMFEGRTTQNQPAIHWAIDERNENAASAWISGVLDSSLSNVNKRKLIYTSNQIDKEHANAITRAQQTRSFTSFLSKAIGFLIANDAAQYIAFLEEKKRHFDELAGQIDQELQLHANEIVEGIKANLNEWRSIKSTTVQGDYTLSFQEQLRLGRENNIKLVSKIKEFERNKENKRHNDKVDLIHDKTVPSSLAETSTTTQSQGTVSAHALAEANPAVVKTPLTSSTGAEVPIVTDVPAQLRLVRKEVDADRIITQKTPEIKPMLAEESEVIAADPLVGKAPMAAQAGMSASHPSVTDLNKATAAQHSPWWQSLEETEVVNPDIVRFFQESRVTGLKNGEPSALIPTFLYKLYDRISAARISPVNGTQAQFEVTNWPPSTQDNFYLAIEKPVDRDFKDHLYFLCGEKSAASLPPALQDENGMEALLTHLRLTKTQWMEMASTLVDIASFLGLGERAFNAISPTPAEIARNILGDFNFYKNSVAIDRLRQALSELGLQKYAEVLDPSNEKPWEDDLYQSGPSIDATALDRWRIEVLDALNRLPHRINYEASGRSVADPLLTETSNQLTTDQTLPIAPTIGESGNQVKAAQALSQQSDTAAPIKILPTVGSSSVDSAGGLNDTMKSLDRQRIKSERRHLAENLSDPIALLETFCVAIYPKILEAINKESSPLVVDASQSTGGQFLQSLDLSSDEKVDIEFDLLLGPLNEILHKGTHDDQQIREELWNELPAPMKTARGISKLIDELRLTRDEWETLATTIGVFVVTRLDLKDEDFRLLYSDDSEPLGYDKNFWQPASNAPEGMHIPTQVSARCAFLAMDTGVGEADRFTDNLARETMMRAYLEGRIAGDDIGFQSRLGHETDGPEYELRGILRKLHAAIESDPTILPAKDAPDKERQIANLLEQYNVETKPLAEGEDTIFNWKSSRHGCMVDYSLQTRGQLSLDMTLDMLNLRGPEGFRYHVEPATRARVGSMRAVNQALRAHFNGLTQEDAEGVGFLVILDLTKGHFISLHYHKGNLYLIDPQGYGKKNEPCFCPLMPVDDPEAQLRNLPDFLPQALGIPETKWDDHNISVIVAIGSKQRVQELHAGRGHDADHRAKAESSSLQRFPSAEPLEGKSIEQEVQSIPPAPAASESLTKDVGSDSFVAQESKEIKPAIDEEAARIVTDPSLGDARQGHDVSMDSQSEEEDDFTAQLPPGVEHTIFEMSSLLEVKTLPEKYPSIDITAIRHKVYTRVLFGFNFHEDRYDKINELISNPDVTAEELRSVIKVILDPEILNIDDRSQLLFNVANNEYLREDGDREQLHEDILQSVETLTNQAFNSPSGILRVLDDRINDSTIEDADLDEIEPISTLTTILTTFDENLEATDAELNNIFRIVDNLIARAQDLGSEEHNPPTPPETFNLLRKALRQQLYDFFITLIQAPARTEGQLHSVNDYINASSLFTDEQQADFQKEENSTRKSIQRSVEAESLIRIARDQHASERDLDNVFQRVASILVPDFANLNDKQRISAKYDLTNIFITVAKHPQVNNRHRENIRSHLHLLDVEQETRVLEAMATPLEKIKQKLAEIRFFRVVWESTRWGFLNSGLHIGNPSEQEQLTRLERDLQDLRRRAKTSEETKEIGNTLVELAVERELYINWDQRAVENKALTEALDAREVSDGERLSSEAQIDLSIGSTIPSPHPPYDPPNPEFLHTVMRSLRSAQNASQDQLPSLLPQFGNYAVLVENSIAFNRNHPVPTPESELRMLERELIKLRRRLAEQTIHRALEQGPGAQLLEDLQQLQFRSHNQLVTPLQVDITFLEEQWHQVVGQVQLEINRQLQAAERENTYHLVCAEFNRPWLHADQEMRKNEPDYLVDGLVELGFPQLVTIVKRMRTSIASQQPRSGLSPKDRAKKEKGHPEETDQIRVGRESVLKFLKSRSEQFINDESRSDQQSAVVPPQTQAQVSLSQQRMDSAPGQSQTEMGTSPHAADSPSNELESTQAPIQPSGTPSMSGDVNDRQSPDRRTGEELSPSHIRDTTQDAMPASHRQNTLPLLENNARSPNDDLMARESEVTEIDQLTRQAPLPLPVEERTPAIPTIPAPLESLTKDVGSDSVVAGKSDEMQPTLHKELEAIVTDPLLADASIMAQTQVLASDSTVAEIDQAIVQAPLPSLTEAAAPAIPPVPVAPKSLANDVDSDPLVAQESKELKPVVDGNSAEVVTGPSLGQGPAIIQKPQEVPIDDSVPVPTIDGTEMQAPPPPDEGQGPVVQYVPAEPRRRNRAQRARDFFRRTFCCRPRDTDTIVEMRKILHSKKGVAAAVQALIDYRNSRQEGVLQPAATKPERDHILLPLDRAINEKNPSFICKRLQDFNPAHSLLANPPKDHELFIVMSLDGRPLLSQGYERIVSIKSENLKSVELSGNQLLFAIQRDGRIDFRSIQQVMSYDVAMPPEPQKLLDDIDDSVYEEPLPRYELHALNSDKAGSIGDEVDLINPAKKQVSITSNVANDIAEPLSNYAEWRDAMNRMLQDHRNELFVIVGKTQFTVTWAKDSEPFSGKPMGMIDGPKVHRALKGCVVFLQDPKNGGYNPERPRLIIATPAQLKNANVNVSLVNLNNKSNFRTYETTCSNAYKSEQKTTEKRSRSTIK